MTIPVGATPLRIGLNATCFNDRPSGARQRFVGIFGALFERRPDWQFVIYEPADCRIGEWFDGVANIEIRRTPIPSQGRVVKTLSGYGYWRKELGNERFDIFEQFNLPALSVPFAKTLLTIHDIRGLSPEAGILPRAMHHFVTRSAVRRVDHVVTVSETMRSELLSVFPKVGLSVIYNGLDSDVVANVTRVDIEVFVEKYALPDTVVLAVGHFEARKNYLKLVEAIALLRDRGREIDLLVIGNDSGELPKVKALIAARGLDAQVKILSGLSDLEVRCAYAHSSLFAFPSSYEGFGIPLLEAMAAGCPFICSDLEVFREITQDQGVYFDCGNVEAIASAVEIGLDCGETRQKLCAYGKVRVRDFSFDALAAELESVYLRLTSRNEGAGRRPQQAVR